MTRALLLEEKFRPDLPLLDNAVQQTGNPRLLTCGVFPVREKRGGILSHARHGKVSGFMDILTAENKH